MENISFIEDENSLVILLDKKKIDKKTLDLAKELLSLQIADKSHIPYVAGSEQNKKNDLVDFFKKSPLYGLELDLERSKDTGREFEF
ncbi:MAG: hypothetical protein KAH48_01020 [Chlorobi bacterium]|nr:hypothetical protein [Chlorobiota bacterium]